MIGLSQARRRPIPGTIGLIFGGLWSLLGALALPPPWRLPVAIAGAAISLLLIVQLWRTRSADGDRGLFARRAYILAVILEVVAIYAASALLPRYGLQAYFIQAVGIIVGLHFLGLWQATKAPRFLWICGGLCAVSGLAVLLPATAWGVHLRDAATGFGNAGVLWLNARGPGRTVR